MEYKDETTEKIKEIKDIVLAIDSSKDKKLDSQLCAILDLCNELV